MEDYSYYEDDDFEEAISGESSKKVSAVAPKPTKKHSKSI